MTVAEGLNEVKRIYALVVKRGQNIKRYSSKVRKEPDELDHQQEYIDGQRKSAEDLIERYLKIKEAIEASNLQEEVVYIPKSGKEIRVTVARALLYKQDRGAFEMLQNLYMSFSIQTHANQLNNYVQARAGKIPLTEEDLEKLDLVAHRFYDEKEIMQKLEDLDEFKAKLDVLLDASNHKTTITI
jgi:hypothetical protein